ncbi:hypothetical protein Z043_103062 [Scleropages formosus]|uniref:Uncharacterized protein n=1 Tax=Scleropages formosus TaxID=113540 RepID=A0A0P7XKZ9_SCLFO|nr:hypothetical protein Z043_103062 [Scleropages formosus]
MNPSFFVLGQERDPKPRNVRKTGVLEPRLRSHYGHTGTQTRHSMTVPPLQEANCPTDTPPQGRRRGSRVESTSSHCEGTKTRDIPMADLPFSPAAEGRGRYVRTSAGLRN